MDEAAAHLIATQLAGIDGKVDRLLEATSQHAPRIHALEEASDDHETRIRGLEEARWGKAGIAALATAAAAVIGALVLSAPLALHAIR